MNGKDFWEDLDIDAALIEAESQRSAQALINQYGKELTEADLLKLNAYSDSTSCMVENIIASEALRHYKACDYTPTFIHDDMKDKTSTRRPWWKIWS